MKGVNSLSNFKSLLAASSVAMAVLGTASSANAQASATVTFAQVGADVVVTLTGNVNMNGFFPIAPQTINPVVGTSGGGQVEFGGSVVLVMGLGTSVFTFDGTSNPWTNFSGPFTASSSIGDGFGINPNPGQNYMWLPVGYSGGALGASMTFSGTTLGTMGLTAGNTHRWTYGSGGVNEFKIVATSGGTTGGGTTGGGGAVPEPGEWAAMGVLGAGLTGLVIRKRRRA